MPRLEREVGAVQPKRALAPQTDRYLDTLLTQEIEPAPADARIRINRGGNDAADACRRYAFNTRTCPADVTTRLERAEQRRAARKIAGFVDRTHFRVRPTRALVISLTDDGAVISHDDRADHRVRTRRAAPALRKIERTVHVLEVGQHPAPGSGPLPLRFEQRVHVFIDVERYEIIDGLADADIADRQLELARDCDGDAALRGSIELGEHDAVHPRHVHELARLAQPVLPHRGIEHKEHFVRRARHFAR